MLRMHANAPNGWTQTDRRVWPSGHEVNSLEREGDYGHEHLVVVYHGGVWTALWTLHAACFAVSTSKMYRMFQAVEERIAEDREEDTTQHLEAS